MGAKKQRERMKQNKHIKHRNKDNKRDTWNNGTKGDTSKHGNKENTWNT